MDRAIVVDNRDPSKRGRIKVQIPTKTGKKSTEWIWPVSTSGYLVLPKPGDQVWVLYEANDENYPVWLGKTETTTSYKNRAGRNLGDISVLLERIKTLEEEVDKLWAQKAPIGHGH